MSSRTSWECRSPDNRLHLSSCHLEYIGAHIVRHARGGESGQPSRDTWVPYGDRYSCLVVVPEFALANYPDDQWYPLGNMIAPSGTAWNPKANWTYTAIEHIFDDVRGKTGATGPTYLLFGHSAGAQFVHRLVTFLPEARFEGALSRPMPGSTSCRIIRSIIHSA